MIDNTWLDYVWHFNDITDNVIVYVLSNYYFWCHRGLDGGGLYEEEKQDKRDVMKIRQ